MKITRREFLLLSAMGLAGFGAKGLQAQGFIPRRTLGKTGIEISILGYGNALEFTKIFGPLESDKIFRKAIQSGINFFDTEPEERTDIRMGRLSRSERKGIISSSKTYKRDANGLVKQTVQSIENLGLKSLDIMILHALDKPEDVEKVCGRSGAAEGFKYLKKNNLIRFSGISGHKYDVLVEAARRFPVDVVMCPVNMVCGKEFKELAIPEFKRLGVGVIAMKAFDGGELLQNFWFRNFVGIRKMIRYVWDSDVASLVVGIRKEADLDAAVEEAKSYSRLAAGEKEQIEFLAERLPKNLTLIHEDPAYLEYRRFISHRGDYQV